MEKETKKSKPWGQNAWRIGLAAILAGVIVFTLYSIESNIDTTATLGSLAPQNYLHHPSLRRSVPPSPASIAEWMTFDYLNNVFKMPPAYLKNALKITDSRYPRLTIGGYATTNKIDPALTLAQVKAAVESFVKTK